MNLCIDVGNTQVKLGIYQSLTTKKQKGDENLVDFLRFADLEEGALEDLLLEYDIRHVILSSVRGEHEKVMAYLKERLETVIKLSANLPVPIQNAYETPQTLGNDRLAVAVAATTVFPNENVLVVDAGTCITYDFVDKNAVYRGGSILPGIDMRFKALHQLTAKLPLIERENLDTFVGTSTKTSIQTGIMQGVLHELRGFKSQYEQKFGHIRVIVTGGDASYFESQLKNEIFAQPKLVLIGLNRILDYNIEQI